MIKKITDINQKFNLNVDVENHEVLRNFYFSNLILGEKLIDNIAINIKIFIRIFSVLF